MTKKQAQQHYDWYISSIPERVRLLAEHFHCVWRHDVKFDYSLESLNPLWAAFEKHVEAEEQSDRQVSEERVRLESAGLPAEVIQEMLSDRRDLTKATYAIALDIAMYLGEVLARHLPGIHWGFLTKPRDMASVNQPVLLGFRGGDYLDPRQIVLVGCWRSLDAPNPRFLSEVVEVWSGYLPVD